MAREPQPLDYESPPLPKPPWSRNDYLSCAVATAIPLITNGLLFWKGPRLALGRPRLSWLGPALATAIFFAAVAIFTFALRPTLRRAALLGFALGAIAICALRMATEDIGG